MKSKIIFSIYNELPEGEIPTYKSEQFRKYRYYLERCKRLYAHNCGATFQLFSYDGTNYQDMQFYKIQLLEELADVYDEVLYLDFDVVPNTSESLFESLNLNKLCILEEHATDRLSQELEFKMACYKTDHRYGINEYLEKAEEKKQELRDENDEMHRWSKVLNKRDMLLDDFMPSRNDIIHNTGIIAGSSECIKQLKFTERLDHMKEICRVPNNEVFMSYIIELDGIQTKNLGTDWHRIHDDINTDIEGAKMIHFISKDFGVYFD